VRMENLGFTSLSEQKKQMLLTSNRQINSQSTNRIKAITPMHNMTGVHFLHPSRKNPRNFEPKRELMRSKSDSKAIQSLNKNEPALEGFIGIELYD